MLANLDVVDLGCGSGVYVEYLLTQGVNKVTCIDYAEEMVRLLSYKSEPAGESDRVVAHAQDLSLGLPNEPDSSTDLVISSLMVHYLEDLNRLFSDVYRVLKRVALLYSQPIIRLLTFSALVQETTLNVK